MLLLEDHKQTGFRHVGARRSFQDGLTRTWSLPLASMDVEVECVSLLVLPWLLMFLVKGPWCQAQPYGWVSTWRVLGQYLHVHKFKNESSLLEIHCRHSSRHGLLDCQRRLQQLGKSWGSIGPRDWIVCTLDTEIQGWIIKACVTFITLWWYKVPIVPKEAGNPPEDEREESEFSATKSPPKSERRRSVDRENRPIYCCRKFRPASREFITMDCRHLQITNRLNQDIPCIKTKKYVAIDVGETSWRGCKKAGCTFLGQNQQAVQQEKVRIFYWREVRKQCQGLSKQLVDGRRLQEQSRATRGWQQGQVFGRGKKTRGGVCQWLKQAGLRWRNSHHFSPLIVVGGWPCFFQ